MGLGLVSLDRVFKGGLLFRGCHHWLSRLLIKWQILQLVQYLLQNLLETATAHGRHLVIEWCFECTCTGTHASKEEIRYKEKSAFCAKHKSQVYEKMSESSFNNQIVVSDFWTPLNLTHTQHISVGSQKLQFKLIVLKWSFSYHH